MKKQYICANCAKQLEKITKNELSDIRISFNKAYPDINFKEFKSFHTDNNFFYNPNEKSYLCFSCMDDYLSYC